MSTFSLAMNYVKAQYTRASEYTHSKIETTKNRFSALDSKQKTALVGAAAIAALAVSYFAVSSVVSSFTASKEIASELPAAINSTIISTFFSNVTA